LDVGYIYLNPSYRPFVVLNKTYTDTYEVGPKMWPEKKGHGRNGQRRLGRNGGESQGESPGGRRSKAMQRQSVGKMKRAKQINT